MDIVIVIDSSSSISDEDYYDFKMSLADGKFLTTSTLKYFFKKPGYNFIKHFETLYKLSLFYFLATAYLPTQSSVNFFSKLGGWCLYRKFSPS